MSKTDCDIAIIGAGPYGLASAAHIAAADGLSIRVFGQPMSFWEQQMPAGMVLRSPYVASNISDPTRDLTLDDFESSERQSLSRPVSLEQFVGYGRWFQKQTIPELDRRFVDRVEKNGHFNLSLVDGESVRAKRVVVAGGIMPFAWKPPIFRGLPSELVSHSSEHRDLGRFAGRRVVVIGGGQSALESAALLHEAGAHVEVVVRNDRIYFLRRGRGIIHRLGPITKLLFAPAEVGPAGISRLVSTPSWYRRLPRRVQDRFSVRSLRPAGAAWLQPRLADVPITVATAVRSVAERDGEVELTFEDGGTRRCDHVLLATGYRVDVSGYDFLPQPLLDRVSRVNGYPRLDRGFESSLEGLHFVGAPAAWSYGPLMRFVAGTEFVGPVLARAILAKHRRTRS